MAISRYNSPGPNRFQGTATAHSAIHRLCETGQISFTTRTLKESERLDILAGQVYGNSKLWWIIAAASGIGWGLQAPPGTLIRIPTSLAQIGSFI